MATACSQLSPESSPAAAGARQCPLQLHRSHCQPDHGSPPRHGQLCILKLSSHIPHQRRLQQFPYLSHQAARTAHPPASPSPCQPSYLAGEEHSRGHLLHGQVPDAGGEGAPAGGAEAQLVPALIADQMPGLTLPDGRQHIVEADGALEERGQFVMLMLLRRGRRRRGRRRRRRPAGTREDGGGHSGGRDVLLLAAGLASAGGRRAAHRASPRRRHHHRRERGGGADASGGCARPPPRSRHAPGGRGLRRAAGAAGSGAGGGPGRRERGGRSPRETELSAVIKHLALAAVIKHASFRTQTLLAKGRCRRW